MAMLMTIGEFSRLTHVSVKALRHYHDVGLLEPADVDPETGYRSYATAQIPTAQVIRRFRELDMPIDTIKSVLQARDLDTRDEVIVSHLRRMETQLAQTQSAVAALRSLLDGSQSTIPVEYRSFAREVAIAIRSRVSWDKVEAWLADAFEDLYTTLDQRGQQRAGPDGALYSTGFFEAHFGDVTAFIPVDARSPAGRRVADHELPGGRYAVAVHHGPFAELDRTYGSLGTIVVEQGLSADGPIRENYLVTEAEDPSDLCTEVCWPIAQQPRRTTG